MHVGDSATLARHPRFEALFARLEASSQLGSVWDDGWSAALEGASILPTESTAGKTLPPEGEPR